MSKHRQTPCWKVCRVEVILMTRRDHRDCCDCCPGTKSCKHLKATLIYIFVFTAVLPDWVVFWPVVWFWVACVGSDLTGDRISADLT